MQPQSLPTNFKRQILSYPTLVLSWFRLVYIYTKVTLSLPHCRKKTPSKKRPSKMTELLYILQ